VVGTDVPWAVARASMLSRQSSSMVAATEAMRAGVQSFFFSSGGAGHQCFHHSSPF
jgi:hypothetical protein